MDYSTHIAIAKDIYDEAYSKFYGFVGNMKLSEKNTNLIQVFLEVLEKNYGLDSIGRLWLFDYIIFQVRNYDGQDTLMNLQPSWVFGEKAFARWLGRDRNYLYYNRKFCTKYGIIIPIDAGIDEDGKDFYQNTERGRFYNMDQGLLHCTVLELNNDPDCRLCKKCNHKNSCYGG